MSRTPGSSHRDSVRGQATLKHTRITLADGTQVGLTVGGCGVPVIFLHGIGFNRYAYSDVLRRLATRGFLVVAWDAPGHGQSSSPFGESDTFDARVRITQRVIDELGIQQAILIGHSMGGRMAVELAAASPERTIAAVLVSAAIGEDFDESRDRVDHLVTRIAGALGAAGDTLVEQLVHRRPGPFWYARMAVITAKRFVAEPSWLSHVVRAVIGARPGDAPLETVGRAAVPTFVIHGARDRVVPYAAGVDAAVRTGAVMVGLPSAYHSWLIASPDSFMAVIDELFRGELGDAVRHAAHLPPQQQLSPETASVRQRQFVHANARITDLAPTYRVRPIRSAFGSKRVYRFSRVFSDEQRAQPDLRGLA